MKPLRWTFWLLVIWLPLCMIPPIVRYFLSGDTRLLMMSVPPLLVAFVVVIACRDAHRF